MSERHRVDITDFVADWETSLFASFQDSPWVATSQASRLVTDAVSSLSSGYSVINGVAIHDSAVVEKGSNIKGPAIIGPNVFVGAGALIRGGVFLDKNCIVGHACELKTTFMFSGAKVAHLSFVGDSIVGARANIESGAVVANYRNELDDKRIRILRDDRVIDTEVEKFGALIGDDTKIGANAVIAPGAILASGTIVPRLSTVDQYPQ